MLLMPCLSYGQFSLSTEIDARNAIIGGTVNERAYDGVFNIGFQDNSFLIQASYETFKAIDFQSFGINAGYVFKPENNLNFILTGGLSIINRKVNWLNQEWHNSAEVNTSLRYNINKFFIQGRFENRYRGDIKKIKQSGYMGIGYNFN